MAPSSSPSTPVAKRASPLDLISNLSSSRASQQPLVTTPSRTSRTPTPKRPRPSLTPGRTPPPSGDNGSRIAAIERDVSQTIRAAHCVLDIAAVVKELVENALDAGASRIDVRLRGKAGLDGIVVSDNGCGVTEPNFTNLCLPNTTSKITEDLTTLSTFGFRGEALATLCKLARSVTVTTKCRAPDASAWALRYDERGELSHKERATRMCGTTVALTDLFYALPVRRSDFTAHASREVARCVHTVQALSIIRTGVRIELRVNAHLKLSNVANDTLRQSIQSVLGRKVMASLMHVDRTTLSSDVIIPMHYRNLYDTDRETEHNNRLTVEYNVHGYVSSAALDSNGTGGRARSAHQYLYVNGRPVEIPRALKLINDLYKRATGLASASPAVVLDFLLPPWACDVNLSPDKRHVLIHEEDVFMDGLSSMLEALWMPTTTNTIPLHQQMTLNLGANANKGSNKDGNEDEIEALKNTKKHATTPNKDGSAANKQSLAMCVDSPAGSQPTDDVSNLFQLDKDFSKQRSRKQLLNGRHAKGLRLSQAPPSLFKAMEESMKKSERDASRSGGNAPDDDTHANETGDAPSVDVERPFANNSSSEEAENRDKDNANQSQSPSDDVIMDEEDDVEDDDADIEDADESEAIAKQKEIMSQETNSSLREDENEGTGRLGMNGVQSQETPVKSRKPGPSTPQTPTPSKLISNISAGDRRQEPSPAAAPSVFDSLKRLSGLKRKRPSALASNSTSNRTDTNSNNNRHINGNQSKLNTLNLSTSQSISDYAGRRSAAAKNNKKTSTLKQQLLAGGRGGRFNKNCERNGDCDCCDPNDNTYLVNNERNEKVLIKLQKQAKARIKHHEQNQESERSERGGAGTGEKSYRKILERSENSMDVVMDGAAKDDVVMISNKTKSRKQRVVQRVDWDSLLQDVDSDDDDDEDSDIPGKKNEQLNESNESSAAFNKASIHDGAGGSSQSVGNDIEEANKELSRLFKQEWFTDLEIIGQFNRGFLICKLNNKELFIIDQHASDEKYNFETLQRTTTLSTQRLVAPMSLEYSAQDEILILQHINLLKNSGYEIKYDGAKPPTQRLTLCTQLASKHTIFGEEDLKDIIYLLKNHNSTKNNQMKYIRPPRIYNMYASRACRKSIMIGMALHTNQMKQILSNLSTIEHPWTCPHGRPTMRHLCTLAI